MSKYPFNDILNLEKIQTLPIGSILIDTNPNNGRRESLQKPKYNNDLSLKDYLLLFPDGMTQSRESGCNSLIFSKMWFNGVCQPHDGSLPIKNLNEDISNWLNEKNIPSIDQKFAARSPEQMNTLFGCMKLYGGTKRFSPKNNISSDKMNNLITHGVVLKEWEDKPIPVRYALRSQKTKHGLDFLFLLGGSDSILEYESFDQKIINLRNNMICIEDFFKENKDELDIIGRKEAKTYLCGTGVWMAHSDIPLFKNIEDEEKNFVDIQRNMYRFACGIIFIRNFMLYAKSFLGESSYDVLEFNGSDIDVISVDEVIDRYDDIYRYIKNVLLLTNLA